LLCETATFCTGGTITIEHFYLNTMVTCSLKQELWSQQWSTVHFPQLIDIHTTDYPD